MNYFVFVAKITQLPFAYCPFAKFDIIPSSLVIKGQGEEVMIINF